MLSGLPGVPLEQGGDAHYIFVFFLFLVSEILGFFLLQEVDFEVHEVDLFHEVVNILILYPYIGVHTQSLLGEH